MPTPEHQPPIQDGDLTERAETPVTNGKEILSYLKSTMSKLRDDHTATEAKVSMHASDIAMIKERQKTQDGSIVRIHESLENAGGDGIGLRHAFDSLKIGLTHIEASLATSQVIRKALFQVAIYVGGAVLTVLGVFGAVTLWNFLATLGGS